MIGPFAAALFDLDDTLHDDGFTYRTAALRASGDVAASLGIEPGALVAAYVAELERFWIGLRPSDLGASMASERIRMWTVALSSVGVTAEVDGLAVQLARAYGTHRRGLLRPFPGAVDLLARLRSAGRKTALITNGFAETHREKVALLGLEGAFDAVVFADEAGLIKPDPRIFRHACELVGVAPNDSVMVGDRYERDVRGAADAGLATVWLNPAGDPVPLGGPEPDAIVASFDEVAEALGFEPSDAAATSAPARRS